MIAIPSYINANWIAPPNIGAITTTKLIPTHYPPNLPELVHIKQTHSTICIRPETDLSREADASVTSDFSKALIIKTADCLPILLCNESGTEIAAIHAGWRGLCHGIIESTLKKMHTPPHSLVAWIGPSICKKCFEIGNEVREEFLTYYPSVHNAFNQSIIRHNKWHGDLPKIADMVLNNLGVKSITHSNLCTFEQKDHFFSYRRAQDSGRIHTIIWFKN